MAREKRGNYEQAEERKRQVADEISGVIRRFGPIIEDIALVVDGQIIKDDSPYGDQLMEGNRWLLYIRGIKRHVEICFHPDDISMKTQPPDHGDYHFESVSLRNTTDVRSLEDSIRSSLALCVQKL